MISQRKTSFDALYCKDISLSQRFNNPIFSRLLLSSSRKASENSTQSKFSISTEYSYKCLSEEKEVSFFDLNELSFNSSLDDNNSDIEEIILNQ